MCRALKAPLGLYIQDVEQVRGLGLAREVDAEVEATCSTRTIVMELGVGGDSRISRGFSISPTALRTLSP